MYTKKKNLKTFEMCLQGRKFAGLALCFMGQQKVSQDLRIFIDLMLVDVKGMLVILSFALTQLS